MNVIANLQGETHRSGIRRMQSKKEQTENKEFGLFRCAFRNDVLFLLFSISEYFFLFQKFNFSELPYFVQIQFF
jgi:hypothetical protein